MNKNNGIVEYKESFITKIKNFFKNLFGKKQYNYSNFADNVKEIESAKNDESQDKFFEDLKIDTTDVDNVINKRNFLEEIDGNVAALKLLSVDRLRKMEKYYDKVIKENEKKIKKLKSA